MEPYVFLLSTYAGYRLECLNGITNQQFLCALIYSGGSMKKLLVSLMVVACALSVAVTEAQAKRLGGGGSFGKQSQSIGRQGMSPAPNQAAKPGAPAAAQQATPPKPASPWKGILGGALLGL